jgi:long-chain acyl-CoA synthetase
MSETDTNGATIITPLLPSRILAGKRLVVVGGTGFLGKVWVSMLLHRFPDIGHLFLLVRAKAGQTAEERFWAQIAASPCFDPIRERHPGAEFEKWIASKITACSGDIVMHQCGLDPDLLTRIDGTIDAVVNVAGVVDFNPPLDEALEGQRVRRDELGFVGQTFEGARDAHEHVLRGWVSRRAH